MKGGKAGLNMQPVAQESLPPSGEQETSVYSWTQYSALCALLLCCIEVYSCVNCRYCHCRCANALCLSRNNHMLFMDEGLEVVIVGGKKKTRCLLHIQ